MTSVRLYRRALEMLAPERGRALALTVAGVLLAVVQLAEPILFGRMVDALATGAGAFRLIGLWAALGIFGIAAGAVVAIAADRLAHRRRLAALADAYERAITLPIAWHAEKGTGAIVRAILAGTDALFALWLAVLREHLTAVVSILLLDPDRDRARPAHGGDPRPAGLRLRRAERPRDPADPGRAGGGRAAPRQRLPPGRRRDRQRHRGAELRPDRRRGARRCAG